MEVLPWDGASRVWPARLPRGLCNRGASRRAPEAERKAYQRSAARNRAGLAPIAQRPRGARITRPDPPAACARRPRSTGPRGPGTSGRAPGGVGADGEGARAGIRADARRVRPPALPRAAAIDGAAHSLGPLQEPVCDLDLLGARSQDGERVDQALDGVVALDEQPRSSPGRRRGRSCSRPRASVPGRCCEQVDHPGDQRLPGPGREGEWDLPARRRAPRRSCAAAQSAGHRRSGPRSPRARRRRVHPELLRGRAPRPRRTAPCRREVDGSSSLWTSVPRLAGRQAACSLRGGRRGIGQPEHALQVVAVAAALELAERRVAERAGRGAAGAGGAGAGARAGRRARACGRRRAGRGRGPAGSTAC